MGIVNSCSSNLHLFFVTVYSHAHLCKCFSTNLLLVAFTILEEPLGCLDFLIIVALVKLCTVFRFSIT